MPEGHVPPPEPDRWEPPPAWRPSATVPRWAVPSLVISIACSLAVAKISYDYFASHAPGVAMAYMFGQIPFLVVGLPLMLYGALGVAAPRTARQPLLRIPVVAGVIVWWYLVLDAPKLLA
jgi:hypothetical protein